MCYVHVGEELLEKSWLPLKNKTTTPDLYTKTLFKLQHHPLQSTTQPSSKYHITLFKVPHHPLQSTTPPSSKYHTTLFKVPHHPLQNITSSSSKYHTTLFKVPHNLANSGSIEACTNWTVSRLIKLAANHGASLITSWTAGTRRASSRIANNASCVEGNKIKVLFLLLHNRLGI